MHKDGLIQLEDRTLCFSQVLFDSGALNSSYIAKRFVDEHYDLFRDKLVPINSRVCLADGKTTATIAQAITLPVCFHDPSGNAHRGLVTFAVLDTNTNAIIGLPDILGKFLDFFIAIVQDAADSVMPVLDDVPQASALAPSLGEPPFPDVVYPWSSVPLEGDSPEEEETPDPCSFTGPLYYLSKPHEEAVQDYFALFESHIAPDFLAAACPELLDLLRSDVALDVFVPKQGNGLQGCPDLELECLPTLPARMPVQTRPINPRLYENAKKEFDRLFTYFYVFSDSPVASPLVIAAKATPPFIRYCGDYQGVNKFVKIGVYYIPNVPHSIEKARGFAIYIDLDMSNSFHQIRLGPVTSNILSVQTPWGLVRPLFLPEGVGPASGILQTRVMEIFKDFADWTIVIFDNFLILAHDFADAFHKLRLVLQRCRERGVVLKFSKSWLGFTKANFFGYEVSAGKYELSEARKQGIAAIPFPSNLKAMQRFLGAAIFFKSFVRNFSLHAAPLTEMTKKDFNWDRSAWKRNYEAAFEAFKIALQEAVALHFPDYTLEWFLRTDASDVAVGAVLFQERPQDSGPPVRELIACASKKFSDQARRWDTYKKEAFSMYWGALVFAYYLRGKVFTFETDHRNLLWIEASTTPIIMRWRVFLQSFAFWLRHIPGVTNTADMWTRMYPDEPPPPSLDPVQAVLGCLLLLASDLVCQPAANTVERGALLSLSEPAHTLPQPSARNAVQTYPPEHYLKQVHGGRNMHRGVRYTWLALNKYFPGHRISYAFVAEYIATCPYCQKYRLGMQDSIEPVYRHLKPAHHRARVGVDRVTVTPEDCHGNNNAVVVVDHFSKHVNVTAASDYSATSMATALFVYFCTFGVFDEVISDPGSDLMSEAVAQVNQWLGVAHKVSLVDRHQSNGVEGTNKILLRHLTALVNEERIKDRWSEPSVLCLINFALNDAVNSESGVRPFDAKFGSADATYFQLPAEIRPGKEACEFIKLLDKDLRAIRATSKRFQDELVAERTRTEHAPNEFQPGDFVLHQWPKDKPKPTKLSAPWLGPYEVIQQKRNDVTCRHLVTGVVKVFHVVTLKIFHGDRDTAYEMALRDDDQHVVKQIRAYRGDPMTRTTMQFLTEFADGDVVWLTYCKDIAITQQFEQFCRLKRPLYPLLFSAEMAVQERARMMRMEITEVQPGDTVYVDLRYHGATFYDSLGLPDADTLTYVVPYKYTKWSHQTHHKRIAAFCELFDEFWPRLDNFFVYCYGSCKEFDVHGMVLVDIPFCVQHPNVLPEKHAQRLLRRYTKKLQA